MIAFFVEHDAVYVRYAPGRRADAEAAIRRVLEKFGVPEERIVLSSLDEYISGHYEEETYYANLLSALTVFSVLITFSGVFSMLLYSLRLRRRSMAIRRVMGAGFGMFSDPNSGLICFMSWRAACWPTSRLHCSCTNGWNISTTAKRRA